MVTKWSTFRTLFVACLVHLLSFCSGAPRSIGTITCGVTGQTSGCGIDEECSAECRYPCSKADVDVIGTVNYTDSSSICKAAFHDLRITFYSRAITFVRRNIESRTFMGSYRYGVQSQSSFFSGNTGWFQFTSSRISEPVLDVTTLHKNFLYRNGESPVFECHGPKKGFQAEFAWYPEFLTQTTVIDTTPKKENGYFSLMVPETEFPTFKTTGYWCRVKNNVLSDVGSVAMFYDPQDEGGNYPDFLPEKYSTTVSTGQDFSVPLQRVRSDGRITGWTKDGLDRLVDPIIRHNLTVQKAQISDGGLYFAEGRHTATPGKNRALTRVIVRACPVGIYGPNCEHSCSDCQNGGICHDITGDCICPPGFNGSLCENPCGDDSFGADCSKKCSSSNANKEDKTCKGILMCRPDPYGCSCGTGFKGFFCNETCDSFHYGAGCTQYRICHCSGKKSCNIYTGTCLEGCDDGWKGTPFCNVSYPLLYDSPTVTSITPFSLHVEFAAWNPANNLDTGEGNPKSYLVQYKESLIPSQWKQKSVPVEQGRVNYSLILNNLQPDTDHSVRVIVVDSDGRYREHGAQETKHKTMCGSPMAVPEIVNIEPQLRNITVTWKVPPKSSWRCRTANITVLANGQRYSFNLTENNFTSVAFESKPFTNWTFSLRMETLDGGVGPWTPSRQSATLEDVPSQVENLTVVAINSTVVLVSWDRPKEINGILRRYDITYKQIRWAHECNLSFNDSTVSKSVQARSVTIDDLAPSAVYRIFVEAVTVDRGKLVTMTVNTSEAAPEMSPTVEVSDIRATVASAQWTYLPCNQSNGEIRNYTVQLVGRDDWAESLNTDVRSNSIRLFSLVPYTKYEVRVSGNTDGGRGNHTGNATFTTHSAAPPAPSNVTVYHLSQSSISLTWLPPYPPHGNFSYYVLRYDSTELNLTLPDVTCNEATLRKRHCYTLRNLEPRKTYRIKIMAVNEVELRGVFSPEIRERTEEMMPGPPANVTVTNRTETSFSVAWVEPFRTNGNLTFYRVNLSLISTLSFDNDPKRNESLVKAASSLKLLRFQDLSPASVYNVCVEASTKIGYGDPLCISSTTRAEAPSFRRNPLMPEGFTNGTLKINLQAFNLPAPEPLITGYYIVVVQGNKVPSDTDFIPLAYNASKEQGLSSYSAAYLLPNQINSSFLVGDGRMYNGFHNHPLDMKKEYRIGLIAQSNFDGETRFGGAFSSLISNSVSDGTSQAGSSMLVAVVIIVLLIVATIGAGACYFVYKRRTGLLYRAQTAGVRMKNRLSKVEDNITDSRMTLDMDMTATEVPETLPRKPLSKHIAIKDLPAYVEDENLVEKLKREYLSVAKGQLHPWEDAKRPENKNQNRYGNILPYDHTRVKLSKIADIEGSDYINASYIPGYKFPRRYIATQGPKSNTIDDFWRMVWEEMSCKIIMLTNLKEEQKVKCEKYWPDTCGKYGELQAKFTKDETFTDFTVRKFHVSKGEEKREVHHFHFTTWPDHSVPMYPHSVYPFIKAVHDFMPDSPYPIIVHCSGGIGRTGTFILIDTMLTMASQEEGVDILGHLYQMRSCRVDMIESLEQYIFVYKALSEILCAGNHKMKKEEFLKGYNSLKEKKSNGKSAIDEEFEKLRKVTSGGLTGDAKGAMDLRNTAKNRNSSIIPADNKRPHLKTGEGGADTDYINAVFVDGFLSVNRFLVTQLPLPNTVDDFWQMMIECNSTTIATLNSLTGQQQETPRFWPSDECSVMYKTVLVEHMNTEVQGPAVVRTLRISQLQTEPRVIKQFHLMEWPATQTTPTSAPVLIDFIDVIEKWQQESGGNVIVVQCMDGNKSCGVYCAAEYIREQIRSNQEVDVFQTVKNIRNSRPHFIINEEQYGFCYAVAFSLLETDDIS